MRNLIASLAFSQLFLTMKMMMTTRWLLLAAMANFASGWTPSPPNQQSAAALSRRDALFRGLTGSAAAVAATTVILAAPQPAAALGVATPAELAKLQKGHARVSYLLKNWDEVTSVCNKTPMSETEARQIIRTGGGGGESCEKTPLKVQEYLGYKSIEDPLYRADKIMLKAVPLVPDPDNADAYFDAMERYREKADQSSLMAYTSSWGEANQGGKQVGDDLLELTKADVVESEKLLRKVLGYLELEVLPPSK